MYGVTEGHHVLCWVVGLDRGLLMLALTRPPSAHWGYKAHTLWKMVKKWVLPTNQAMAWAGCWTDIP